MKSSRRSEISSAHRDDLALLPESLRAIADLVGLDGTLALVNVYGGVRLYVPRKLPPNHVLISLLGAEPALRLAAEYGGRDHFDIPRAAHMLRAVRNRRIRADREQGASRRDLALKYQITERAVDKILGSDHADDRQVDLFGLA